LRVQIQNVFFGQNAPDSAPVLDLTAFLVAGRNQKGFFMAAGGKRYSAGRKPLPVAVKKIKGTLQKCRTNLREPKPTGLLGDPPAYMTETAQEAWRYAVSNAPAGLLSSLDAAVLERWANCAGMYREALAKINRAGVSGMIIKTPGGVLRRSPMMDVIRDLAMEMKGYESEMGFTPASRARVSVVPGEVKEHNPWDDIA
jgi:P27 family predicted phage terminase small subunit